MIYVMCTDDTTDIYEKYLTSHTSNVGSEIPTYYLRCGDNWLEYLPPDSKDPREEGEADAKKYTIAKRKSPYRFVDDCPH